MRKNRCTAIQEQEWEDPLLRSAITAEEVKVLADGIQIGDKIQWKVWNSDLGSQKSAPKKKACLTVVRKSRYLLEAADGRGRIYSIRYVELAEAKRRDWARVKEMLRKAEQAGGRGK